MFGIFKTGYGNWGASSWRLKIVCIIYNPLGYAKRRKSILFEFNLINSLRFLPCPIITEVLKF